MPLKANALAPALFVAAIALVGDYAALSEQRFSDSSRAGATSESTAILKLRSVIASLIDGLADLDAHYAQSLKKLVILTSIDQEDVLLNEELLKATRKLEEMLRTSLVPSALRLEHEQLRRFVAKVRNRLSTMDLLSRQFFVRPDELPTQLEPQALRDLADHTTTRIVNVA